MAVLIIVGLARSGKDTVADYIAKNYMYTKYTFSTVLSEMIQGRGEEATKEKMIRLGDLLRSQMGMDAIAKMLGEKITQSDNILLVGPRSIEEIEFFRKKYPNPRVVKVTAVEKNRFSRRSRIDPEDRERFFGRDEADLRAKGMQKVLDAAEFGLRNDENKQGLYRQADELMKKIGN